jgi:hypothetical protein
MSEEARQGLHGPVHAALADLQPLRHALEDLAQGQVDEAAVIRTARTYWQSHAETLRTVAALALDQVRLQLIAQLEAQRQQLASPRRQEPPRRALSLALMQAAQMQAARQGPEHDPSLRES